MKIHAKPRYSYKLTSLFDSPITNRAVPKYGEEGYEEFIQDFKEYEALVMQLLDDTVQL